MLTQIPGLDFEVDGDLIHLEQNDGAGNIDRITLHRLHLRHLAEECGLLAPAPLPAVPLDLAGGPEGMDHLEVEQDEDGAIVLLQTRVRGMGGTDAEIHLHPLQAVWLAAKLASIVGSNDKSDDKGISVTQSGRGRPSSGTAMTNAERQARHRAKQADLLPATEPA